MKYKEKIVLMLVFFITILIVYILNSSIARVILGFVFVFFLPGYALTSLLFPKDELDNIEKFAYSVGLSICVVVIDGLILDKIWEISLVPILISLSIFIIATMISATYLRLKL